MAYLDDVRAFLELHDAITTEATRKSPDYQEGDDIPSDYLLNALIKKLESSNSPSSSESSETSEGNQNFLERMKEDQPISQVAGLVAKYFSGMAETHDDSLLLQAFHELASNIQTDHIWTNWIDYLHILIPAMPDFRIDYFNDDFPFHDDVFEIMSKLLSLNEARWDILEYMITKFDVCEPGLIQLIQNNLMAGENSSNLLPYVLEANLPGCITPAGYQTVFHLILEMSPALVMPMVRAQPSWMTSLNLAVLAGRLRDEDLAELKQIYNLGKAMLLQNMPAAHIFKGLIPEMPGDGFYDDHDPEDGLSDHDEEDEPDEVISSN
jgi:hypothetical protein